MTTLVTGASGFVGSAVARVLVERGEAVRVLVRPTSDRRNLESLDAESYIGDLRDRRSLDHALRQCDALFHVAADYRLWAPDSNALYRTNVDGTRMLMEAAAEAGIARVVYTSSVATLGIHPDATPADEDTPVSLDDMIGHYKRSKFEPVYPDRTGRHQADADRSDDQGRRGRAHAGLRGDRAQHRPRG
jgi:dihydroflavonol-4-reductase